MPFTVYQIRLERAVSQISLALLLYPFLELFVVLYATLLGL